MEVQITLSNILVIDMNQKCGVQVEAGTRYNVMLEGKIVLEGNPDNLTEEQVKKAYFGI